MGLYHSLFEWYHPLYLRDKANNYTTTAYIDEVLQPQLRQIVNDYQPSVIWADGEWFIMELCVWNFGEISVLWKGKFDYEINKFIFYFIDFLQGDWETDDSYWSEYIFP